MLSSLGPTWLRPLPRRQPSWAFPRGSSPRAPCSSWPSSPSAPTWRSSAPAAPRADWSCRCCPLAPPPSRVTCSWGRISKRLFNCTGWSIWSRNTVWWHQIKSSPTVNPSHTKVQLLFQCQQKLVLEQMDHPVVSQHFKVNCQLDTYNTAVCINSYF